MCSVDFLCQAMHGLVLEGSGTAALEGADPQQNDSGVEEVEPDEEVRENASGGGALLQSHDVTVRDSTGELALWRSYIPYSGKIW